MRKRRAVRQTREVKVDVKTLDGKDVTWERATQPVGSALRIAPAFRARSTDDDLGVDTSLDVRYSADAGSLRDRCGHQSICSRGCRDQLPDRREGAHAGHRSGRSAELHLPHAGRRVGSVRHLDQRQRAHDGAEGRILPPALAEVVVRRGSSDARMEAIELLYGAAALSSLPPAQLIQRELGIPHRTASAWIIDARKAGRLTGMNYNAGRPAGA